MIFQKAPPDFKKEIDVCGCYMEYDGRFILLHRHAHKTNGNKWGLPAGKVNPGETIFETMVREIGEETGIIVDSGSLDHIGSVQVRNEGHDIGYHMFLTKLSIMPEVKICPEEHQAFCWAYPAEALTMELIHDQGDCIRLFYKI